MWRFSSFFKLKISAKPAKVKWQNLSVFLCSKTTSFLNIIHLIYCILHSRVLQSISLGMTK